MANNYINVLMFLFIIVVLIIVRGVVLAEKSYEGYKVYSVTPKTLAEIKIINSLGSDVSTPT